MFKKILSFLKSLTIEPITERSFSAEMAKRKKMGIKGLLES